MPTTQILESRDWDSSTSESSDLRDANNAAAPTIPSSPEFYMNRQPDWTPSDGASSTSSKDEAAKRLNLMSLDPSNVQALLMKARSKTQFHEFHVAYLRSLIDNSQSLAHIGQVHLKLAFHDQRQTDLTIGELCHNLAERGHTYLMGYDEPQLNSLKLLGFYYRQAMALNAALVRLSQDLKDYGAGILTTHDTDANVSDVEFIAPFLDSSSITHPDTD